MTHPARIGDFVFNDLNANGIQDGGEPGIAGATVILKNTDGTTIAETVTGSDGVYSFDELLPGQYQVTFVQPDGFNSVSPYLAGEDTSLDSNANPNNGLTSPVVTLNEGQFNRSIDAGFYNDNSSNVHPAIDLEKLVKPIIVTPGGGEGLSLGFWKTHSEFGPAPEEGWDDTGYEPTDSYEDVFQVDAPGSPTLLDALNTGGGGVNNLLRQSTAALLNAANPFIDYAYSEEEIIQIVQDAYSTGNFEEPANLFDEQNNLGADLNTPATGGEVIEGPIEDADVPTGPSVPVGQTVEFIFELENTGNVPLGNIDLFDDNKTPDDPSDDFAPTPVLNGSNNVGDTNFNFVLDPGEKWLYGASEEASFGQQTNLAQVYGEPLDESGGHLGLPDVYDADAANYIGV
jgi:hypothetical protein